MHYILERKIGWYFFFFFFAFSVTELLKRKQICKFFQTLEGMY